MRQPIALIATKDGGIRSTLLRALRQLLNPIKLMLAVQSCLQK
jgi:hypothetical protein